VNEKSRRERGKNNAAGVACTVGFSYFYTVGSHDRCIG